MSTPWSLQVLTPDYLIEGQIDSNDILQKSIINLAGRNFDNLSAVTLSSIKIQPTGSQQIPDNNIASWTFSIPYGIIGVIPRDEGSLAEVLHNVKRSESTPAGLLIGPYKILGNICVNPKFITRAAALTGITLTDITLDRITSDSQIHDIKAAAIVVSTHLLQGLWLL